MIDAMRKVSGRLKVIFGMPKAERERMCPGRRRKIVIMNSILRISANLNSTLSHGNTAQE
jgi:hypothetical protein